MQHADVIPVQRTIRPTDARRPVSFPQAPSELAALWVCLWRSRWAILATALCAVGLGGWYGFRVATPLYTATVSIALESREQQVVDFESVMSGLSGDQSVINTEIEVLRSRDLLAELVRTLNLTADPAFGPSTNPGWFGAPPARPIDPLGDAIDRVQQSLTITNLRNSLVFRISATSPSPETSAALANTLADLYIADQIEVKRAATRDATEWLRQRAGELQGELDAAQAALAAFTAEAKLVTPEEVAALNRHLGELRSRLASVLAADGTSAQISALRASLRELEREIAIQSTQMIQLQRMEHAVLQARDLFDHVQNRLRETALQQGIQQADARIISHAAVPRAPSDPKISRILGLSVFLGLLVGTGFALLTDRRQSGLKSAEELESLTGEVVMGQLPLIKAKSRDALLDALASNPTSLLAEAVRNLRTSVLLSDLDCPPQVIMSTSSVQGEGKTIQSLALAQSFATGGKSVLLIEGDIRRRVFSRSMGFSDSFGLLSVLSDEAKLSEVVQTSRKLGPVDIVAAEASNTNPVDVFSSERFGAFLKAARAQYDIILIDTPPLLAVPDSRVIAQHCDAILYAVKWNATPRSTLREGLRLLETVNVHVSGLVLTQIDQRRMEGFGLGSARKYGAGYYSEVT